MIFTRKLGKIFRGQATPAQLMMAAVIGTTAGFMPGFLQAPGLLVVLFLAAVVLNANLALIGIALVGAILLSFPLLPVTFWIGHLLLDGPLSGFFAALINAPVLALFGFEHYVTTGGLVVGLVLGTIFGLVTVRAVGGFRRKMAQLDKDSEAWRRFQSRRLTKLLVFIFIGGGHGKRTYEELLAKTKGGLFRPLGLVAAGLVVVVGFVVSLFASDAIVRYALQSGLERANGATVDLEQAELDLGNGKLVLSGLAMADPEALGTDLFRAAKLEADISQADLLRKRMHIERLTVSGASTGEDRRFPGELTRPRPKLETPPPTDEEGEQKTLEDYLREAEKWRERLAQVADWLDRISGMREGGDDEAGEAGEPLPEDEERRVLEDGYRNAVASHLIEGAPTLLVTFASVEEMRVAGMPEATLDVVGENLSTQPFLVEESPRLTIRSSDENLLADVEMAAFAKSGGENSVELVYLNLPVDRVAGDLKFSEEPPIQGGTIDFRTEGNWTVSSLDLPVEITLRDTRLALPEIGETTVEELLLPITVSGPFRNPRIHFTDAEFADALAAAGKAAIANRVRSEADELKDEARQEIEEEIGEELGGKAKELLDGLW